MKINEQKLHRHKNASLHIKQAGTKINVEVSGHKYDILHMLIETAKTHFKMKHLFEQTVFYILGRSFVARLEKVLKSTPVEKIKERSIN